MGSYLVAHVHSTNKRCPGYNSFLESQAVAINGSVGSIFNQNQVIYVGFVSRIPQLHPMISISNIKF